MIPERCTFCKGTLQEGKTEFIARVGEGIIVIRDVPAYICDRCEEAYYTVETSRKIDAVMVDAHSGRLCCRPLAAGEVELHPGKGFTRNFNVLLPAGSPSPTDPLTIVEAKRRSKDPLVGQKQAEQSRRPSQTADRGGRLHQIHLFVNSSTGYMKEMIGGGQKRMSFSLYTLVKNE